MKKSVKIVLISLGATICLIGAFIQGFLFGIVFTPSTADTNLAAIEKAYRNIVHDYVEPGKIDRSELSQAAIQAMVDVLNDPYSAYLDPGTYRQYTENNAGIYGGIGAEVGIYNGQITLVSVFANSPAAGAGFKTGDVILEVNGVSTSGMSVYEAVSLVKGEKGTEVKLLMLILGEAEPRLFSLIRAEILRPSVSYELIDGIAYIALEQFGERSDEEIRGALVLANAEARGIVLDLRGNPGGGLQTVVDIVSRFVTDGTVLTVRYNDGSRQTYLVHEQDVTTSLPVVVLVNSFSASASEVLAGALQDHGRAVIAGTTTFGKGSVNYLEPLPDGSAIYITVARWLTPEGRLIEGEGITPDEFLRSGEDWVQWAVDYLSGY